MRFPGTACTKLRLFENMLSIKAHLDQRDYANAPVNLSAFQRDNF